jgi:hypothetical protein
MVVVKQLVAWGLVAVLAMQTRAEAQQPQPQQQPQSQPQQQPQPQSQPQQQPQSQPQPPQQPQSQPQQQQHQQAQQQPQQQQQQPQQPPPFYRFTLNDGRVIDVQIVGGDATNYHVQTGGAVYSVPRASVVSSVALAQPVVYAAPPPPEMAQPVGDKPDWLSRNRRTAGWVYFAMGYFIVAPIALAKMDNDDDASSGLIPVVGPLIWTMNNDSDDAFEDGWDWLAATDTLIQGLGIYLVITGGKDSSGNTKTVRLTPMTGRGTHGFAIGGSF